MSRPDFSFAEHRGYSSVTHYLYRDEQGQLFTYVMHKEGKPPALGTLSLRWYADRRDPPEAVVQTSVPAAEMTDALARRLVENIEHDVAARGNLAGGTLVTADAFAAWRNSRPPFSIAIDFEPERRW